MKFDILLPQVISEQGKQPVQQDYVWPQNGKASIHDRLFIVADGMGNDDLGAKASQTVTKAVTEYLFTNTCPDEPLTNDLLRMALVMAYERLAEACPDGVGASIALLYMHRHGCSAVHIGDCRIYQIRPSSMALVYKSTDDFKAMMAQSKNPVAPEVKLLTNVRPGDYFLVCTKSLTAHLTDAQVVSIVCGERDDARKRQLFVNRSLQVEDNHSGVLVQVSGVMIETTDHVAPATATSAPVRMEQGDPAKQRRNQPAAANDRPAGNRTDRLANQPKQPAPPHYDDDDDEKKGGFPIVAVSALAIVLIGCLLWWWMTRSSAPSAYDEPDVPATEQKDSVPQKDTMKIVDTKSEVKRDTARIQRSTASDYKQKADSLLNAVSAGENAQQGSETQPSAADHSTLPSTTDHGTQPSSADHSTQPSTAAPANPSQGTSQSQGHAPATQQPASPNGGVTPRPVIPEE